MRRSFRKLTSTFGDPSIVGALVLCVGIATEFGTSWGVMVGGLLTLLSSEVRG